MLLEIFQVVLTISHSGEAPVKRFGDPDAGRPNEQQLRHNLNGPRRGAADHTCQEDHTAILQSNLTAPPTTKTTEGAADNSNICGNGPAFFS